MGILGFLATALCSTGNVLRQLNIGAPRWLWLVLTVIGLVLFCGFWAVGLTFVREQREQREQMRQ